MRIAMLNSSNFGEGLADVYSNLNIGKFTQNPLSSTNITKNLSYFFWGENNVFNNLEGSRTVTFKVPLLPLLSALLYRGGPFSNLSDFTVARLTLEWMDHQHELISP